MKSFLVIFCIVVFMLQSAGAVTTQVIVSSQSGENRFPLVTDKAAPLITSSQDFSGIPTIANYLQADIQNVTGKQPEIIIDTVPSADFIVIIGTLGKAPLVDALARQKKISANDIIDRWDSFLIQTVENPFPHVKQALVIAGSNKRGTFYGMFELSKQIGVSPWYWWADVAVPHQDELYVLPGLYFSGEPAVKYRGIFLNDEEPALGRWAVENYGGFTAPFYEKLFELMLRMKANYLWPAMWWASFNSDDPQNPKLADEYGIVMGTTHHEPMNRAHAEWRGGDKGPWNYETNTERLQKFWREGIERMGDYETIVTLAMRGDGDMAMSADTNIALLEKIVSDQREILADVTKKDITTIPQLWALYKEVQDYYDSGMRVPNDVTLLLCDDNWGNIRKLPHLTDKPRPGGYGIYYHFDYVGGPRNYKWLNTNQIERTWEQMHLAYEYGVDRIWLVNVGDLKPMEFPIEFFLDYAWNPQEWPASRLPEYSEKWCAEQFGSQYATQIAELMNLYTKYNSRRKHELLSPETYSLQNYCEFERIVTDFNSITAKAESLYELMPQANKDAFYQLVLHPIKASANLNELYFVVAKNRLYAKQGRALTNVMAQQAQALFDKDSVMSAYYNHTLANGKWNNMMSQTHISYTYWQQPEKDVLPKVAKIELPEKADMGVALDGSLEFWPSSKQTAILPELDPVNKQFTFVEIFNRGSQPFEYKIQSKMPWILFSEANGQIEAQRRIYINVDWLKAPAGIHKVPVIITGAQSKVIVEVSINNSINSDACGFVENNGFISIQAEHFSRKADVAPIRWQIIPNLGKTGSAVAVTPVTAPMQKPGEMCPYLAYDFNISKAGDAKIQVTVSPTLNFHNTEGLRYAISVDDAEPQFVNIHENFTLQAWEEAVRRNGINTQTVHALTSADQHELKIWLVDPAVVFQKIVIDLGGLRPSYLGPPESVYLSK